MERSRCIPKPEGHTLVAKSPDVGGEACFILVRFSYRDLPIPTVRIERRKHGSIPKAIDTIVQPRQRIRVSDSGQVQTTVVDAKSELSILLRRKNYRARPFAGSGLNDASLQLLVNMRLGNIAHRGLLPIRHLVGSG